MLGFKLGKPQRMSIVRIIASVLRYVRQAASLQLGVEVTEATARSACDVSKLYAYGVRLSGGHEEVCTDYLEKGLTVFSQPL